MRSGVPGEGIGLFPCGSAPSPRRPRRCSQEGAGLSRSFPHATSQTLLAKFKQQHEDNRYFQGTPVLEPAFIIRHFAGKVKYQIKVPGWAGVQPGLGNPPGWVSGLAVLAERGLLSRVGPPGWWN